MDRDEVIKKHSNSIFKWLNENNLDNTMDNIRRYYALYYGLIPIEEAIKDIHECISGMK